MKTDLVILGGGPAGLTAGIYASRARIPSMLIERAIPGGQMAATEWIDNYPGFNEPILGFDLSQRMEQHARRFGLEIAQDNITSIAKSGDEFNLTSDMGTVYSCKALILATGASPVKLGIPGEGELSGKGVSYCAVCDGPFFRDMELAVVGGGDSAVEEAIYLTRFAERVHLIHRRDELRAIKEIQEKAFAEPKISIHWSRVPTEIIGDSEVKAVKLRSTKDGSESELAVAGIFFYVGIRPNAEGLEGLVETDAQGFIITDAAMACSTPGVFAAGDLRSKILRQVTTAVGDGAQAAFSAQKYLESLGD